MLDVALGHIISVEAAKVGITIKDTPAVQLKKKLRDVQEEKAALEKEKEELKKDGKMNEEKKDKKQKAEEKRQKEEKLSWLQAKEENLPKETEKLRKQMKILKEEKEKAKAVPRLGLPGFSVSELDPLSWRSAVPSEWEGIDVEQYLEDERRWVWEYEDRDNVGE